MKSATKLKALPPPKSNGVVSREAPEERTIGQYADVNTPVINEEQFRILYGKTPAHAIRTREGRGGRTFKYIQHGHTTDRLNKAFGFAWSFQLLPISGNDRFMLQIYDETTGKPPNEKIKIVRDVAVYGELTVQIYDAKGKLITTVVKGGMGSQRWEMGTEFGDALKGAESDAKKFAAKELGIGLDLYYDDDAAIERYEQLQSEQEARKREEDAWLNPPEWIEQLKAMRARGESSSMISKALNVPIAEINRWSKTQ